MDSAPRFSERQLRERHCEGNRVSSGIDARRHHYDEGVTGIYARWHMFEEKHEAVMAADGAVSSMVQK